MVSLYAKDLHPDTTEEVLFDKFSQKGPLISIRLSLDAFSSKKTLGYAYINYQKSNHARDALESFNHDVVKYQPIKLMISHADLSEQKSYGGHILIQNIHESMQHKEFYEIFFNFGHILSCRIFSDDHGRLRGDGYVHYDTEAAAAQAAKSTNGKLFRGKVIYVVKFHPKFTDAQYCGTVQNYRNVYVKNFGPELDDDGLYDLFTSYGNITSAKVMMDELRVKSKGFGFVCFSDCSCAEAAVKALNDSEYEGRRLYCGPAMKKEVREKVVRSKLQQLEFEKNDLFSGPTNVYISNLEESVDNEQLRSEFSKFGEITSVAVMMGSNGKSKGFGFVCYKSIDEAHRAINEMDGTLMGSKKLFVELAGNNKSQRHKSKDNSLPYREEIIQRNLNPPLPAPPRQIPLQTGPPPPPPSGFFVFPVSHNPHLFPTPHTFYAQPQGPIPRVASPFQRPLFNGVDAPYPVPHLQQPPVPQPPRRFIQAQPASFTDSMGFGQFTSPSTDSSSQSHKMKLKEVLYPMVCKFNEKNAHNITNILVEMNDDKLQHILHSRKALKAEVEKIFNLIHSKSEEESSESSSSEEEDSSEDDD